MALRTQSLLDRLYLVYFIVHIPITVLIDSCIVVPPQHQLALSLWILDFHVTTNKDILLIDSPVWFQAFGAVELVFQLPLFFYATHHLWQRTPSRPHWVWIVIYGFNAAFTTMVCLVYVAYDNTGRLTTAQKANLIAIYTPYLLIPLVMMLDYAKRITRALAAVPEKKTV